jgi:phosphoribosylformimino-5-aminoimidazole carboxamide ribotide isomerase
VSPFEVIPAIDVMGGRLVRLAKGDPASLHVFPEDPVEVALRFVEQGTRWLHFVDLDAAFSGGAANVELLARLAELPVRLQAGGGLRPEEAARALEVGADRAIVGAASLDDRPAVEEAIASLGDRIAVGLDVRGGRIVPRGSGRPGPPLRQTVAWLDDAGCARFVYTDVNRDGALTGPDLEGLRELAAVTDRPILASGGVASLDDLRRLAALGPPIEGAVVGRALYEDGLELGEALRAVATA